jgi:hypothetical protein
MEDIDDDNLDTWIIAHVFLFYTDGKIHKVNVDKAPTGYIRNRYFTDETIHSMLEWIEFAFNHHTRAYYFRMPRAYWGATEPEYVFFVNIGKRERELPIDSEYDMTVSEFWHEGQVSGPNFSASTSRKMNMAQSLGILKALDLPPFHCDVVEPISTADVAGNLYSTVSVPDPDYWYERQTSIHDWAGRRVWVDTANDEPMYTQEEQEIIRYANLLRYGDGLKVLHRAGLPASLWHASMHQHEDHPTRAPYVPPHTWHLRDGV